MKKILDASGWLIIIAILASCSTTNKNKSLSKSTVNSSSAASVDSNVVKTTDSTTVKKDNSIITYETTDDYRKETIYEFYVDDDTTNEQPKKAGGISAADYFPPIKRITITETGTKKEKTKTVINKYDSAHSQTNQQFVLVKKTDTQIITTTTLKNKTVKRTSYWGWLYIGLITAAVFAVGWYFGWWRWFFAFIRRTRNKDNYPVKYSKYQPPKPPVT